MSTKCTKLYGKDFHFYYDYKDHKFHLELKKKEVEIPNCFKNTLIELAALLRTERVKSIVLNNLDKLEKER